MKKQKGQSAKRLYYLHAKRLGHLVFSRYRRYLDKATKRNSKYTVGFRYPVEQAWTTKKPVNLRLLCHPVNLQKLTEKVVQPNLISLKRLEQEIKKFEKKVKVTWKWNIPYKFKKATVNIRQLRKLKQGVRVIGLDPGTRNYGVFVGDFLSDEKSINGIVPIESSYIINPLKDIKSDSDIRQFTTEIYELLEHYEPDIVIMERFVSRGLRGSEAEKIGIMNGIIYTIASGMIPRIIIKFVMAATWKNRYNKYRDLKKDYENIQLSPHQFDSAMIALFALAFKDNEIYQFMKKNFVTFTKACYKASIKI